MRFIHVTTVVCKICGRRLEALLPSNPQEQATPPEHLCPHKMPCPPAPSIGCLSCAVNHGRGQADPRGISTWMPVRLSCFLPDKAVATAMRKAQPR